MKPRILVGIVNFTNAKDYCNRQFREMLNACVTPVVGAENIVVASERFDPEFKTIRMDVPGVYAEDMLTEGREAFRKLALHEGYDRMVWQGVDAFWQSRQDFERVLAHDVPLVSPLICARQWADKAIARRFVQMTEEQVDIPDEELEKGGLIPSGFPGADNICIRRDVFTVPFKEEHTPWYVRVGRGDINLCVEENWILQCSRIAIPCYIDADVKVWHVHEDRKANMWKGISVPLDRLRWNEPANV